MVVMWGAFQKSADAFETANNGPMLYPVSVNQCFKCVSCDDDSGLMFCVKHMWRSQIMSANYLTIPNYQ